jgi:hypothetical protein
MMNHATPHRRFVRLTLAAAAAALATAAGCMEHVGPAVPSSSLFAAQSVDVRDDRAAIPFTMHDGVPVVTVRYAEPRVTAVLATGDPAGHFPMGTASLLDLSPADVAHPVYLPPANGELHRSAGLMHADAFTFSGVTFHDFDVAAEWDAVPEVATAAYPTAPPRAHGVLGGQMFRNVLLTVDYPNALLWVEHGQLPPVDGIEVLPLVTSAHGHPLIDVHVGPTHYWAKLDTGCPDALRVPTAMASQFAGPVQLEAGHNVLACGTAVAGPDGLITIGSGSLRDFAVTFDMAHGRVRLHRRIDATASIADDDSMDN